MGRKKKTRDENKEPWFDDPNDNVLPWGAPIITAKDVAEEIDKAPPLSYLKDKFKEIKVKRKRTRRKKTEWDDLFKDPLTKLREGYEWLKSRKQGQREETVQKPQAENGEHDEKLDVAKSVATATTSCNDAKVLKKEAKENTERENSIMSQKDISISQSPEPKMSSKPRKTSASLASDSKSEFVTKSESKKRKKVESVSDINKEIKDIQSRLDLLMRKLSDQEKGSGKVHSEKESINDSIGEESDEERDARKSEVIEKPIKPNCKDEKLEKTLYQKPKTSFPTTEGVSDTDLNKRETQASPGKEDTVKNLEKPLENEKEKGKSDSSKKKKIKSKQKKRDEKEFKKFIKNLDADGLRSDKKNRDCPAHGGRPGGGREGGGYGGYFGSGNPGSRGGWGMAEGNESNNMYGTTPLPLDSELIVNQEHSIQRTNEKNISRFLDSTLTPGDGDVLPL